MITYFKTQIDLADALKEIIDKYWALELEEDYFINHIKLIKEKNEELLFKDGDYTSAIQLKLGVKRLKLLDKILKK